MSDYPKILAVETGRLVPQDAKRSLIVVTKYEDAGCLRVEEHIRSGHIIGRIEFAADDPELSVTGAIEYFREHINHWGRRK